MPNTEFYAILVKLSLRCRCSSMVECQLPKLNTRVRFPSPAPHFLRQKFFENRKKCLQFSLKYANISSVVNTTYPGVAKFGIALDWGSRGRRFKSCHSDQKDKFLMKLVFFYLFMVYWVKKVRLRPSQVII